MRIDHLNRSLFSRRTGIDQTGRCGYVDAEKWGSYFLFNLRFRHRWEQYRAPSSEAIARGYVEQRKKVPPTAEYTDHMVEGSSSRREEIARGKKPMQPVDEEHDQPVDGKPNEEEEEVVEPVVRKVKRKSKAKKLPPTDELIEILMSMNFKGTRYPHNQTMKDLGIYRDVGYLLDLCHLGTFMSIQLEAHQEETCHFLATLAVHFYDEDDLEDEEDPGLGYITFSVRGEEYSITIKELDNLFGFPSGTNVDSDFDEDELKEFWLTVAGPSAFISGRSKSSAIRSPVLRYTHKAIASTMFARKVIGNVNEVELEMLDGALADLLGCTRTGRGMIGNKLDTSLTCQLLDHLLEYREMACKAYRQNKRGELSIGGVVTPILAACGLELDGEAVAPRWMDMAYLMKSEIIAKEMVNGQYLYRFFHEEVGCIKMLPMPCQSHTAIRMGNNIDFCPPIMLLYPREQEEVPCAEEEEVAHDRPNDVDAEASEQVDAEDDDLQGSPLEEFTGRSLQDAHRHISKLRKWSIKTIKAMKKTISVMGNQIKELQDRPQAAPTPAPAPITGLSIFRRSGSTSIAPRRNIHMEPPRASSFEPRQRTPHPEEPMGTSSHNQHLPQHHWLFANVSSMSQADFHLDPDAPPSSTRSDQLLLTGPPAPAYTRESMEASIDSFFTQP